MTSARLSTKFHVAKGHVSAECSALWKAGRLERSGNCGGYVYSPAAEGTPKPKTVRVPLRGISRAERLERHSAATKEYRAGLGRAGGRAGNQREDADGGPGYAF